MTVKFILVSALVKEDGSALSAFIRLFLSE